MIQGTFFDGFSIFSGFSILFAIMFILVTGMIVFVLVSGVKTWNKNNHSPRLVVPATVVAKRNRVSGHHHEHHHTTTDYYVTFQVESGDRVEFLVSGSEYGLLVEGDQGKLTFQGTRYLGFERTY